MIFFTLSLPKKLKNLNFKISIIPKTLNIKNIGTTNAKSINPHTIRKLINCSLKNVCVKAIITLILSEILLLKVGLYYHQSNWVQGEKGLKFQWKSKKKIRVLMKLHEKWLTYNHWRVLNGFQFFLMFNPSIKGKIEKLDFWGLSNFKKSKHQQLENHKCKVYQPAYN